MQEKSDIKVRGAHRADRSNNTQSVIDVLRRHGPSTQADIARSTALSRATVNNIVQALREQGAVEYHWKNRRDSLVTLTSIRKALVSVKVREKSVNALLLDFATQTRYSIHTNDLPRYRDQQSSPTVVLDLVRQLVDASQSRGSPVAGLAITIEGPIENATGAIAPWAWHRLPKWKGLDIQQHFSRNTQLPLVIDNDANLAALAEWTWGEGRGCDDFLHITCAEGIGGGIVIDGRIYRGGNGLAGEIGHMVIEEAGELCFCGSRGCLSSFVTERAILASLRNTESPKGSLLEVIQSARQGDAACQRVLFEAGLHLGKALATVVRVISPRTIAIGGTLAAAGDILLEGLRSSAEVTNLRAMGKSPVFCLATVINDAPELGGISALMTQLGFGTSDLAPWMLAAAPPEPV